VTRFLLARRLFVTFRREKGSIARCARIPQNSHSMESRMTFGFSFLEILAFAAACVLAHFCLDHFIIAGIF